ncbi:acyltransferase family protein [Alistipes senegalensis]|uniref:Acyltransferase n=1 Tax=Alistipes senegalensis JC50 TaxID=1033732 RepID=A0ABY5V692_9BACT|nr:acyltransferase [Alistipes senegalensis]UEA87253.1 acyltransferase [Alistipes senegalensis]UWN65155.1 acyltransferase [Alistipes senegalensis JC50]
MTPTAKALLFLIITFLPVLLTIRKQTEGGGNCQLLDFNYTNCLRGVAILLIMTGHIVGTMGFRYINPFGGTGVALFLFLSGFGCNESYKHKGLNGFWRKKVKRVLLPYGIVITLIYAFLQKSIWDLSYLLEIYGLQTTYWFIAFLIKWYIVFWATTKFILRWRVITMCFCGLLMLVFLPEIEAEQSLSFLLGVVCSEKLKSVKSLSKSRLAVITILGLVIGGLFLAIKQLPEVRQYEGESVYAIVQMMIKVPFAISLVAVLTFLPSLLKSHYLMLAGIISYELYLVHFPFYIYLEGRLMWAILLFVCSFIVAYVFNRFNVKISKLIG